MRTELNRLISQVKDENERKVCGQQFHYCLLATQRGAMRTDHFHLVYCLDLAFPKRNGQLLLAL